MATIATLLERLFDRRHQAVGEGAQALALGAGEYMVGFSDGQLDEIDRQIVDLGEYPLRTDLGGES